MIMGYDKIGCDAINVGQYELAAGLDNLIQVDSETSIPFISANLLDPVTEEPIFKPYILIDRGGIKFGVIGLTDLVSDSTEQLIVSDYAVAGNIYLAAMEERVDIMVLLLNSDRSTYKDLHKIFPSADLIFTSGSTFMTRPMMNQEENGPFVFSLGTEGRYLNQIDVSIVNKGEKIVNKSYYEAKINYFKKRIDRYGDKEPGVPLNKIYSNQPNTLNSIIESQDEIKRMEKILDRKTNSISFQNVAMESKIKDDIDMLEYVNNALKKYKELIRNR